MSSADRVLSESPRLLVLSNRLDRLWQRATSACRTSVTEDTLISYWDSSAGKPLPDDAAADYAWPFQLVMLRLLNPLSNQRKFPDMLRQRNLQEIAP